MNKLWVWIGFILLGGIHVFLITRYAVDIPDWDDYDAVLGFLSDFQLAKSGAEKIMLLFSQHNEHRIAIDRIISLFDFWLFGKINFYHLIFIGNFFLVVFGYFLFTFFQTRIKEVTGLLLVLYSLPIPLLIFNMESYENFFLGNGLRSKHRGNIIFVPYFLFFATKCASPCHSNHFCHFSNLHKWQWNGFLFSRLSHYGSEPFQIKICHNLVCRNVHDYWHVFSWIPFKPWSS